MRRSVLPVLFAVVVAMPAAAAISYSFDLFRSNNDEADWAKPTPMLMTPMPGPAVTPPATVPSTEAALSDDEEVIGVAVNGKYRAYLIKAMKNPAKHIVNDLFNRVPVTVTYCDVSDYAQAFTSDQTVNPLDIVSGGFDGEMMLCWHDIFFWQRTGTSRGPERKDEAVFPQYPFVRVKWKEWRELHPATDVYIGGAE